MPTATTAAPRPADRPGPPTTPGGAAARPWHALFPGGCIHCHQRDSPYEARGLCKACYAGLRSWGNLWRYPVLTTTANASVYTRHRLRRDAAWERQRAIREADGPWLHAGNCADADLAAA